MRYGSIRFFYFVLNFTGWQIFRFALLLSWKNIYCLDYIHFCLDHSFGLYYDLRNMCANGKKTYMLRILIKNVIHIKNNRSR